MKYPETLEANLLTFAHLLRGQGFKAGAAEVALALQTLELINSTNRTEAQSALRLLFARSPKERAQFDETFDLYFGGSLHVERTETPPPQPPKKKTQGGTVLDWAEDEAGDEVLETMSYSPAEATTAGNSAPSTSEVGALGRAAARLAKRLATKRSRRTVPTTKGRRADLRRSVRRSVARGEMLELVYKRYARGKTRLIFAFDVSGSMLAHSAFLLQLAYAFMQQRRLGQIEVFGFSTELYRLTPFLRHHGPDEALRNAAQAMPGRSGGTKIGACLQNLVARYGSLLGPKTAVIIVSDGWDTGDLETLRDAMRVLQARSQRLVWLNPLAAAPGYEPTVAGMQTALPYVDVFAPGHNLESLEQLGRHLSRLDRF